LICNVAMILANTQAARQWKKYRYTILQAPKRSRSVRASGPAVEAAAFGNQ
jgi:hypothetical protein